MNTENAKTMRWHTGARLTMASGFMWCVSALSDRGLCVPADAFDDDEYEERRGIYRATVPDRRTAPPPGATPETQRSLAIASPCTTLASFVLLGEPVQQAKW